MASSAIAPSILAADFSRLGDLVREVEAGGADRIHVDVMDGHFVPNLSMGPIVVQGVRPVTRLPLEVHLMVTDPTHFAKPFIDAGADSLIVHYEVLPDPLPLLQQVRAWGKRIGMAVNPGTPVDVLTPFLPHLDLALCMTVWPGFGGQAFIPESIDRIARLRMLIDIHHPQCELEVDGGINMKTVGLCATVGANVFVAGNALFGAAEGPQQATRTMRAMVQP